MNMATVDPADFAVFCVDGKPFDVRRRIFEVEDPSLLRDALDMIERQDGDERLLDWLRLRLRVLEMLAHAARVESGEAEPVVRKGSKKRPPARVQVSLLAPVAAPVPEPVPVPVEPDPVVEIQEPEIQAPAVEPVEEASEPAQEIRPIHAPLPPRAPFVPLVDPRPAVLLPIRPRRLSTFEREAPLGLAWVLWFVQRFWNREQGQARLHRRDLSALARGTRPESFERWGLERWHARAWEHGGALETMAAACGLVATYDRHVLTLRLAERSPGESG